MGIAEALAATHGHAVDAQPGSGRQIHTDLKPDNILCFFIAEGGASFSPTLRLADFGEAISVGDSADGIQPSMVPHTKTYRPPEQDQVEVIGFNYDVWCLGCLYLDFVTWFLEGWDGVESFSDTREREKDDPSIAVEGGLVLEDTFFKRARKNRLPSVRIGRRTKTKIDSGRHIRRSSVWMTSSFEVECKVKESVLIVSLC